MMATFKKSIEAYLNTYLKELKNRGMTPSENFFIAREVLFDYAKNMDRQAIIKLKKLKKVV